MPRILCPYCGGDMVLLGTLGSLTWLRCRACGIEVNVPYHWD